MKAVEIGGRESPWSAEITQTPTGATFFNVHPFDPLDSIFANDTGLVNQTALWQVTSETPLDGSFEYFNGGGFRYTVGVQEGIASFDYQIIDFDGLGTDTQATVSVNISDLTARVQVSWLRPTTYTNATILMPNSYQIEYGSSLGGPYPLVIDMRADLARGAANLVDPGMLTRTITGLNAGTTYHGIVKTIDAEGQMSAPSLPWAAVAAIPAGLPTPDATITAGDLPWTSPGAGNYQIAAGVYDSGDFTSTAIIINDDDVHVFADNDVTFEWTGFDLITTTGTNVSGAKVSGFTCTETGGISGSTGFYNALGSGSVGIEFDDMTVTMGAAGSSVTSAVVFEVADRTALSVVIHDSDFTNYGANRQFWNHGSVSNLIGTKVYDNTVRLGEVNGLNPNYIRFFSGGFGQETIPEMYGNRFEVSNTGHITEGVTGIIGGQIYMHGNYWYVDGVNRVRCIVSDNSSDVVALHNYMELTSTAPPGGDTVSARFLRQRVDGGAGADSFNWLIGFNTCRSAGGGARDADCFELGGDNGAGRPGPYDNYIYHNDIEGWDDAVFLSQTFVDYTFWKNRFIGNQYGAHYFLFSLNNSTSNHQEDEIEGGSVSVRRNDDMIEALFQDCTKDDGVTAVDSSGSGTGYDFSATGLTIPGTGLVPSAPSPVSAA